jgi:hypothetical protein
MEVITNACPLVLVDRRVPDRLGLWRRFHESIVESGRRLRDRECIDDGDGRAIVRQHRAAWDAG